MRPLTGSFHHGGMSAKSTTVATNPPSKSDLNPVRLRYKHDQIKNGKGRNQPVNLVAAAQPRTNPNVKTQPQRIACRGESGVVRGVTTAWANAMIERTQSDVRMAS